MKLKLFPIICFTALTFASSVFAKFDGIPLSETPMPPVESRFPPSHSAALISKAYSSAESSDGENASVEGEILSIVTLKDGHPAITVQLSKQPDVNILVLPAIKHTTAPFIHLGNKIRAMGYLRNTLEMFKIVGSDPITKNTLSLQSICIVDAKTLAGVFDQTYMDLCAAWQKGQRLERLR